MRRCASAIYCLLLAATVLAGAGAGAEPVDVPLRLDERLLERSVATALGLDERGHVRLRSDQCNQVDLSDLSVSAETGRLVASVQIAADAGVLAFGRCRGPAHWQGRMNVVLVPALEPDGRVVDLSPESAELVRPDGTAGRLTSATRLLAERVILPRMDRSRIDLDASLGAIDALLRDMLPSLAAHAPDDATLIHALNVDVDGIEVLLRRHIEPAPVVPAQPEAPLDPAELVAWQRIEDELDGFLTHVIVALSLHAPSDDLRIELLGVLLDARHRIAEALAADDDDRDPVRELFVDSWDALRPWLVDVVPGDVDESDAGLRLAAFIAGGDVLRAIDRLGPQYGLAVTRDGLRRLARILLADAAPERFTPLPLDVDAVLQDLLRLGHPAPQARVVPQMRTRSWLEWLIPAAHAVSVSPAEALRGRVPRLATLDEYLGLVSTLLEEQTVRHLDNSSRVPQRLVRRFDPLVRATAWKESCWRQFVGSSENPRVLTSSAGAVGMMQISVRVWRGVYDARRLAEEVDYNVAAGTEILEHYLVDYAIRRREHEHPGGDDNLIRATYAAYNGGPSQIARYRRQNTPASLRAIDNAFWRHYTRISSAQWPEVASCYAVQG
jgi:hypothetical protein